VNYLAIDASTEACSVALQFNNQVITRFELCPQSHSLHLLPMVDQVLQQADCRLTQLDGLIFGQGPGSFTGVRIGVGVAQGLAFGAELPVVGVSTMQAMAQLAYMEHQQTRVIASIDARMSEVYCGYYELDENALMQAKLAEAVLEPQLLAAHFASCLGDDQRAFAVGTGWNAYPELLQGLKHNNDIPDILYPSAAAMLDLGRHGFESDQGVSAEFAQPVYVRDTVSWKKLPGRG
jgi:tRNA threonylcarbamoyladenosine biosynthesis protein TsaB